MTAQTYWLVVFDDDQGLCVPMGHDPECAGAICASAGPVALFASRAEAQRAIRISSAHARLCALQGQVEEGVTANTDFLGDSLRHVKVRKAVAR